MSASNRLEFHISYTCPNSCLFCSEKKQLAKHKNQFIFFNEIKKILIEKKKIGYTHLTLTGGEPSFHPDFIRIVKTAKKLSYKVYVSSNGGRFSEKKFWREVSSSIDEICFSLHGHNAKLHNFHTRNLASFNNLMMALVNIKKNENNFFIFFNIVATRYNFGALEKIVSLAASLGAKQILISGLAPEGEGLKNFKNLVVPFSDFSKKIATLVVLAKRKKIIIRFFGLPLCVLGEHSDYSNDLWWSPRLTIEKGSRGLKETLSLKPTRKRIKIADCRLCEKKKHCGGIFEKYHQEFGDAELCKLKI